MLMYTKFEQSMCPYLEQFFGCEDTEFGFVSAGNPAQIIL